MEDRTRLRAAFARLSELRKTRDERSFDLAEAREYAALRSDLVAAYILLARHLAGKFASRGEPLDDLVQVASIGLLKAVERFAPERGTSFVAYAVPTIVGELRRYFRDVGWTIHVPRRLQDLKLALNGATERLGMSLGRSPTVAELAQDLGVEVHEVVEAREAALLYSPLSLDMTVASDPGGKSPRPLVDRLPAGDGELAALPDRVTLDEAVQKLTGRERIVLYLHFHLQMTQTQIALRINVSQMQVSRIERAALGKLREMLADLKS